MAKRLLGMLLAVLMIAAMIPATAFADASTEGSPNVFSVVADVTGKQQQTEFLFVDTLEQNGETYYGLLIRKGVHNWDATAGQILYFSGTGLDWVDDESQESTETVKYVKMMDRKDGQNKNLLNTYVDDIFPEAMLPYIATLEFDLTAYEGVSYKTVDNITFPTWDILDANKDYVFIGGSDADDKNFTGTITRTASSYMTSGKWFKSMRPGGISGYGQVGANYDYYWNPLVYVTKDFFRNIKIDTTKEIGENVTAFLSENLYTNDVADLGYTQDELEFLGIGEMPVTEGDSFVVGGKTFYLVPESAVEYNGEKYVGVFYNARSIAWTEGRTDGTVVLFDEDRPAGGKYVQFLKGQESLTDLDTAFASHFEAFGDYKVDADFEWKMGDIYIGSDETTTPIYFKGSVGLPSVAEFTKLYENDNVTFKEAYGFTTRSFSNSGGKTWGRQWFYWKNAESHNNSATAMYDEAEQLIGYNAGKQIAYWSPMTYVKESFFLENKIDLAAMSANVRGYLADNFYQKNFADGVYSETEFDIIGVLAEPENADSLLEWSPNYLKLADGTELLYNGQDGDYLNFIIPKDYAGNWSVLGAALKKGAEDGYSEFYLMGNTWGTATVTLDSLLESLPDELEANIRVTTWDDAGWAGWFDGGKTNAAAKAMTKASLPSYDDFNAHGSYLMPMILDNQFGGAVTKENGYKYSTTALARNSATWNFGTYYLVDGPSGDGTTATGAMPGGDSPHARGSVFLTFYAHKDFLTQIKADEMGENVKALFPVNFVKSDLEGLYTNAEIKSLGVNSFIEYAKDADSSMKFVVDGKTFILMDTTAEVDGTKYYGVLYNKKHLPSWGAGTAGTVILGEDRADGGKYVDFYRGVTELVDVQSYAADFEAFGDYMVDEDFEWKMGDVYLPGAEATAPIYHKGSVSLPTQVQIREMYIKDADIANDNPGLLSRTLGTYAGKNNWHAWRPAEVNRNMFTTDVLDDAGNVIGFTSSAALYGVWSPMTYVSEDFFADNQIDLETAGEGFKKAIRTSFDREDLTGWDDAVLDELFVGYDGEGLGLEVIVENGSAKFIVHNNGADAAGKGNTVILASYNNGVLVDVKTIVLDENVSAGYKTSAISVPVSMAGATDVKAMMWNTVVPLTNVATSR